MSLVFFADRNLGRHIFIAALRKAGVSVEGHADHFEDDAPDHIWLPEAAQRGWIILSRDEKILRRPIERDATIASGAALLVLVGASTRTGEIAENFLNTMPKILSFVESERKPFIAKVYRPNPTSLVARGRPGHINRVYPT